MGTSQPPDQGRARRFDQHVLADVDAQQFRKLARRLETFGLGPDVIRLADDASLLLEERHRVVHSVMMIETRAVDEPLYEAWHAKSDTMWPVDPSRLHDLADRITQCTAEVTGLTQAWEERAERDGWPVVP